MMLADVGKLMHLPLTDIQLLEEVSIAPFIVAGAAESLLKVDGRNWIPLIVRQTNQYEYQVIANSFIYAVAKQAGLQRVWCIVTDSSPDTTESIQILSREKTPKVNLSNASKDVIQDALKYLIERPGSPFAKLDLVNATNILAEIDRHYWKDFSLISKLKCGITKAKLSFLEEVFYLTPIEPPVPPVLIDIKNSTREEIFVRLRYLSDQKIGGFEKMNLDEIADSIFYADKSKWASLTPISSKLENKVTSTQIKFLKLVFTCKK